MKGVTLVSVCLCLLFLRAEARVSHIQESLGSQCGSGWQDAYSELHSQTLNGQRPPKYVLVVPPGKINGLADCLTGIMTAFFFAILTGRALVIERHSWPDLTEVYNEPNIHWSQELAVNPAHKTYVVNVSSPLCDPLITFGGLDIHNPANNSNMESIGADNEVVRFEGCFAGNVVALFNNPHHQDTLFAYGLRPETAYGCAHHYLFEVNNAVIKAFRNEIAHFARKSSGFDIIGIHLRTYDDKRMAEPQLELPSVQEAQAAVALHRHYFACAESIDAELQKTNRSTLWYFISDDIYLRHCVHVVYGEKVIISTDPHKRPRHTGTAEGGETNALILAAGEFWLYSLTKYHIFWAGGFGRSAFLSSLRWDGRLAYFGSACKAVNFAEISSIPPYIK